MSETATKTLRLEYAPGKSAVLTVTRLEPTDEALADTINTAYFVFVTYGPKGPEPTRSITNATYNLWKVDEDFDSDVYEKTAEPLLWRLPNSPGLWEAITDGDVLDADDVAELLETYPNKEVQCDA